MCLTLLGKRPLDEVRWPLEKALQQLGQQGHGDRSVPFTL